jgi:hypothetical protein
MKRFLPLLTGLGLVLAAGVVHSVWTQRWHQSAALGEAVARLDHPPGDLGPWTAHAVAVEPELLAGAGAAGGWACRYSNRGQNVDVVLLCGRAGPMCAHRPEHCYPGSGYEMLAAPLRVTLPAQDDQPPAPFWTARFEKREAGGGVQVRIFWSWYTGADWRVPDSPRWTFAGRPYLYKLYVVRELVTRPERLEDDPAYDLLRRLTPALGRTLRAE